MTQTAVPKFLAVLLSLIVALTYLILPASPQRDQQVEVPIAALVIDMQPIYLQGITEREKRREIPNILSAIEFCHENGIPLYSIEMANAGDTISPIKEKLDEYGARYITKSKNSGFDGTNLAKELSRNNIDTIILMGINASVCVKETAEDAIEAGFNICTSKEVIAEPPIWHKGYKTYESVAWYTEQGVYCDRFEDLLFVIMNSMNDADRLTAPTVDMIGSMPM